MIARELQIAEATVKVHVKGLLRKMQVSNRTQAAICALNHMHAPVETGVQTTPSEPMTWASSAASVMNRSAGPIDSRVHAAAR